MRIVVRFSTSDCDDTMPASGMQLATFQFSIMAVVRDALRQRPDSFGGVLLQSIPADVGHEPVPLPSDIRPVVAS